MLPAGTGVPSTVTVPEMAWRPSVFLEQPPVRNPANRNRSERRNDKCEIDEREIDMRELVLRWLMKGAYPKLAVVCGRVNAVEVNWHGL